MAPKALLILCILMLSTVSIPPESLVAARVLVETSENNQEKRSTAEIYKTLNPLAYCDKNRYANCLPHPPSTTPRRCTAYDRCSSSGKHPTVPSPPPSSP